MILQIKEILRLIPFGQNQYSNQGNNSGQNNYGQNNCFRSSNSWNQGTNQNRSMQSSQNQQPPSDTIEPPLFRLDPLQHGFQIPVPLFMWQENHRKFSYSVLLKVQFKSILVMDKVSPLIPLVIPLLFLLLILKCLYPWIIFYMCIL